MGLKPDFQLGTWDGLLAGLQAQRFDVMVDQVNISEARSKVYDFSEPYTYAGQQLMVRKDRQAEIKGPNDLAGKRIGAVLGTNHEKWVRDNVPNAEVRTHGDDSHLNFDLIGGRIDAFVTDILVVGFITRQTGGQVVATGSPLGSQRSAFALHKGSPELVGAIDEALESLRADGTLKQISEKWFQIDVTHP